MKMNELHLNNGSHGLPKNPRRIEKERFAKLCESIRSNPEFMPARPIIVDEDGVILGGNMRYRACETLGMTDIPDAWVQQVTGWTVEKKRRFIIMDNRGFGEDDNDLLAADWSLDELLLAGFDETELDSMFAEAETDEDAEPQVDKAEELQEKWATERGQLWAIGEHRLFCGDSTNAEDVARLLGDRKPLLMVTDPPYGVEYDADWRNRAFRADGFPSDGRAVGIVLNDDRADWREAWELFPGDVAYVWHADVASPVVADSLDACNFERRALIIWAKNVMVIGRGDYHHQHEPCWYCVRKGKPGCRTEDRKQTTLWEIDKPQKSETGHSTQKPVECMARPMRNHHAAEVYDPFLGSGTTMVAAQNLGRKCYGIELNPAYAAVILERMVTAFPDLKIYKVNQEA